MMPSQYVFSNIRHLCVVVVEDFVSVVVVAVVEQEEAGPLRKLYSKKKLRKIRTLFTVRAGVEASAQWAVAPHRKAMSYLSVPSE